ncbi:NADH-quinone oxidoreductase subunit F [compost metagenome]
MLRALEKGQGRAEDIETLLGLVNFLGPGRTFCAHAPGAVEPLGSAIKYFRSEFEAGVAPAAAGDALRPNLAKPIVVGA